MKKIIPILLLISLSGCQKLGWLPLPTIPPLPKARAVAATGARLESSGYVVAPSSITNGESSINIPVPKNSVITFDSPSEKTTGKISVILATDSVLSQTTKSDQVTLAQNFPPPNAPTPVELAKGKAVQWFYFAGIALALASVALIYFQHWSSAGVCALGAIAVPMLGNFLSADSARTGLIVFVAIASALVGAWYLLKKNPALISEATTRAQALEDSAKSELEKLTKTTV